MEITEALGQSIFIAVAVTVVASFSVCSCAKLALKRLLESFKNLQIIVHIMLIDNFTVAHCETFFKFILMISNLELVDLTDVYSENLHVPKDEAIDMHFEETGYEHSDFILCLNTVALVIVMAPAIVLFIILPLRFICCWQRARNFFKRQLDLTFFNRTINFVDATLLLITSSAWINIYQVNRQAIDKNSSFYIATGALALTAACLVALFTYLLIKASKLKKKVV